MGMNSLFRAYFKRRQSPSVSLGDSRGLPSVLNKGGGERSEHATGPLKTSRVFDVLKNAPCIFDILSSSPPSLLTQSYVYYWLFVKPAKNLDFMSDSYVINFISSSFIKFKSKIKHYFALSISGDLLMSASDLIKAKPFVSVGIILLTAVIVRLVLMLFSGK